MITHFGQNASLIFLVDPFDRGENKFYYREFGRALNIPHSLGIPQDFMQQAENIVHRLGAQLTGKLATEPFKLLFVNFPDIHAAKKRQQVVTSLRLRNF